MINTNNAGEITIDGVRATHLGWHPGYVWQCPHCQVLWKELKEIEKMHTGMLWFDNSTATLSMKIQKAMDYYQAKYGKTPDLVLVNPVMMENQAPVEIAGLELRPYRPVLPGHIWIGIEDKQEDQSEKCAKCNGSIESHRNNNRGHDFTPYME